ncbi:hypothetical protein JCM1841_000005 [Sporobolomyces salmonicolor]
MTPKSTAPRPVATSDRVRRTSTAALSVLSKAGSHKSPYIVPTTDSPFDSVDDEEVDQLASSQPSPVMKKEKAKGKEKPPKEDKSAKKKGPRTSAAAVASPQPAPSLEQEEQDWGIQLAKMAAERMAALRAGGKPAASRPTLTSAQKPKEKEKKKDKKAVSKKEQQLATKSTGPAPPAVASTSKPIPATPTCALTAQSPVKRTTAFPSPAHALTPAPALSGKATFNPPAPASIASSEDSAAAAARQEKRKVHKVEKKKLKAEKAAVRKDKKGKSKEKVIEPSAAPAPASASVASAPTSIAASASKKRKRADSVPPPQSLASTSHAPQAHAPAPAQQQQPVQAPTPKKRKVDAPAQAVASTSREGVSFSSSSSSGSAPSSTSAAPLVQSVLPIVISTVYAVQPGSSHAANQALAEELAAALTIAGYGAAVEKGRKRGLKRSQEEALEGEGEGRKEKRKEKSKRKRAIAEAEVQEEQASSQQAEANIEEDDEDAQARKLAKKEKKQAKKAAKAAKAAVAADAQAHSPSQAESHPQFQPTPIKAVKPPPSSALVPEEQPSTSTSTNAIAVAAPIRPAGPSQSSTSSAEAVKPPPTSLPTTAAANPAPAQIPSTRSSSPAAHSLSDVTGSQRSAGPPRPKKRVRRGKADKKAEKDGEISAPSIEGEREQEQAKEKEVEAGSDREPSTEPEPEQEQPAPKTNGVAMDVDDQDEAEQPAASVSAQSAFELDQQGEQGEQVDREDDACVTADEVDQLESIPQARTAAQAHPDIARTRAESTVGPPSTAPSSDEDPEELALSLRMHASPAKSDRPPVQTLPPKGSQEGNGDDELALAPPNSAQKPPVSPKKAEEVLSRAQQTLLPSSSPEPALPTIGGKRADDLSSDSASSSDDSSSDSDSDSDDDAPAAGRAGHLRNGHGGRPSISAVAKEAFGKKRRSIFGTPARAALGGAGAYAHSPLKKSMLGAASPILGTPSSPAPSQEAEDEVDQLLTQTQSQMAPPATASSAFWEQQEREEEEERRRKRKSRRSNLSSSSEDEPEPGIEAENVDENGDVIMEETGAVHPTVTNGAPATAEPELDASPPPAPRPSVNDPNAPPITTALEPSAPTFRPASPEPTALPLPTQTQEQPADGRLYPDLSAIGDLPSPQHASPIEVDTSQVSEPQDEEDEQQRQDDEQAPAESQFVPLEKESPLFLETQGKTQSQSQDIGMGEPETEKGDEIDGAEPEREVEALAAPSEGIADAADERAIEPTRSSLAQLPLHRQPQPPTASLDTPQIVEPNSPEPAPLPAATPGRVTRGTLARSRSPSADPASRSTPPPPPQQIASQLAPTAGVPATRRARSVEATASSTPRATRLTATVSATPTTPARTTRGRASGLPGLSQLDGLATTAARKRTTRASLAAAAAVAASSQPDQQPASSQANGRRKGFLAAENEEDEESSDGSEGDGTTRRSTRATSQGKARKNLWG